MGMLSEADWYSVVSIFGVSAIVSILLYYKQKIDNIKLLCKSIVNALEAQGYTGLTCRVWQRTQGSHEPFYDFSIDGGKSYFYLASDHPFAEKLHEIVDDPAYLWKIRNHVQRYVEENLRGKYRFKIETQRFPRYAKRGAGAAIVHSWIVSRKELYAI